MKITSGQSESVLVFFGPKIAHQKNNPETILHGAFEIQS